MEASDYKVGSLIESSKVGFIGLLVAESQLGRFDILWSDGITYTKVRVELLTDNKIIKYLTEKEILAWRLKHE